MWCNRIEPCIESGWGVKNERALMVDIAMDSEAYLRKYSRQTAEARIEHKTVAKFQSSCVSVHSTLWRQLNSTKIAKQRQRAQPHSNLLKQK